MRKHCGNCANHRNETNQFSDECGKCVAAILENGERTDPSHWRKKPQTNADRIRQMSDEELAEMIADNILTGACNDFNIPGKNPCPHNCKECALEWIRMPHEEE